MSRSSRDIGTHLVDPETSRQGDGAAPAISPDTIDPREPVGSIEARSLWRMAARRFRKHKMAMVSLVVLTMVVLLAFVGGALWHYKYNVYSNDLSFKPSLKHPFGTDSTGFDTFSVVLRGTQRSLEIATFVSISSTIVGTIYGAISGYAGGVVDSIMMRIVDLFLTFPIIAIAAVLTHNIGPKANGWFWISMVLAALDVALRRSRRARQRTGDPREGIHRGRACPRRYAHPGGVSTRRAERHQRRHRHLHDPGGNVDPGRDRAVVRRLRRRRTRHLARVCW